MKIICIGQNYLAHVKEMNAQVPAEPVFFMKPDTALLKGGDDFYLPDFTKELHHEIEVVLKISKAGKHIDEKYASNYYEEISVGIDFTARDLQQEAKKKGLPWEKAKAFDHSAPVGQFMPKSTLKPVQQLDFHLTINGELRQKGNTNDLIFSFDKIISYVSQYVSLRTGDLIFTGTPVGVSAVKIGDELACYLEGQCLLKFKIK